MEASSERKPRVFICVRDEDCVSNFKSHLYEALCQNKFEVCVDDQLRTGDEIYPAIEYSQISVIIFTENYASSRRCLDALVKVMECERKGQIVVPVFYKSYKRQLEEKFADAFQIHRSRHKIDSGKLLKRRKAMSEAANLPGWRSSYFNDDADFIEAIVQDLIRSLDCTWSTGLVGIDKHIASVESLLFSNEQLLLPGVKIIGLWGMGGIGKTTIAAALFEKLRVQYEAYCFLGNVREQLEKFGPNHLRKHLLSTLYGEENILHFGHPSMANDFTVKRLQHKKVFIVLDDLTYEEQLKDIVGEKDNYGPGSRIIVTTLDRQVIDTVDAVYEVQGMDYLNGLNLFSMMAFQQNHPPPAFDDISEKFVNHAAGNPLALKIYGSLLHGKSRREWESTVQKLQVLGHATISKVLGWSYGSLDEEGKNIFLDIACFFKGESKDRIIALLDGCHFYTRIGLCCLQDKSLITISSNNEILMHDLIQGMGKEIVRKKSPKYPENCSRLWEPKDVCYVLKNNLGSELLEGIFLDMSKIEELCLQPDVFNKMCNLRFLSFRASNDENSSDNRCNVQLSEGLDFLPENLRILHWEGYPLKSLPSTYCPEKLVEINLSHSRIEKLWEGVVNLPFLRSVNLSFCNYLAELPNLSLAPSLEGFDVEDCTSLCLIPSSVFNNNGLTTINARGCQGLTVLRVDIYLKSLERINFSGCTGLREFSVISEKAKFLDLSGTAIKELPPTIGCCNKLIELYLRDCISLEHIPDSFSQLVCLETLDLSNCQNVGSEALFPAIEGLQSLKNLKLDDCLGLSKVPDNLSKLSSLNLLSLSGSSIESLPPSVKHLRFLKDIALKDCKRLQHLPELPQSVQRLSASSCISLRVMSDLNSTSHHIQEYFLMSKKDLLTRLKVGYPEEVFFYDCIKLNQSLVNGLLEDARCRIQRAASMSSLLDFSPLDNVLITICLPGSKVPYWFSHQAAESSICCQIPAHSVIDSKLLRFAFCLIVDTSPWNDDSHGNAFILKTGFKCHFAALKEGWIGYSSVVSLTQPSRREHLYIWYDDAFCRYILYGVEKRSNLEINFEFFANINGVNRVKKCGVVVLNKSLSGQIRRSRL